MAEQEAQTPEKHLSVVKIYVKDFSFESPQSPTIFNSKEWAPNTNLNLRSSHSPVDGTFHEVVLTITVDAREKESDKTIFLVELQHAAAGPRIGAVECYVDRHVAEQRDAPSVCVFLQLIPLAKKNELDDLFGTIGSSVDRAWRDLSPSEVGG